MSTALNIAAAAILCLPLLILAVHEHLHRRRAAKAEARLAWIDERIRTQPRQRAAWLSLKRTLQEEDEL
ncbi:hypothetical protein [Streptomyces sp. NPDC046859]|uniref:hypothetical protein n=1 Tax=Streptomyces sp. NPDC046859 TaxID=3155734 RepID=UPI0033FC2574